MGAVFELLCGAPRETQKPLSRQTAVGGLLALSAASPCRHGMRHPSPSNALHRRRRQRTRKLRCAGTRKRRIAPARNGNRYKSGSMAQAPWMFGGMAVSAKGEARFRVGPVARSVSDEVKGAKRVARERLVAGTRSRSRCRQSRNMSSRRPFSEVGFRGPRKRL